MESDHKLIESINEGELDAFETLYHRYRDWVYNLAWRFTGNREQALDVLQETFVYLLKKFPGFELTAQMTTFLYPVVKHISLNIHAKEVRQVSGEEILDEMPAPMPKEVADSRSELAIVLSNLPDSQREVLLMRYVDDMSMQEIATTLSVPVGTVKSRLYNALQILRQDQRTKDYFLQ
jgi:RNA polymerase sigma-70 factor (ECF subfamily)